MQPTSVASSSTHLVPYFFLSFFSAATSTAIRYIDCASLARPALKRSRILSSFFFNSALIAAVLRSVALTEFFFMMARPSGGLAAGDTSARRPPKWGR